LKASPVRAIAVMRSIKRASSVSRSESGIGVFLVVSPPGNIA
jgi:hypothetical protein